MLHRQIMFKQLEELQRQKKLQELNDSRQQNVVNQQSLLLNKQAASGAQYAPLINGTPVRDASQMFMFGNTNLVQGFPNGLPQNQILQSMNLDGTPSFSQYSRFQETNMFGPVFSQGLDMGQQQGGWPDHISEKAENVDSSQDLTTLDPLEQKFLFDTDENGLGSFENMIESTDNSNAFPSLQSGSWSALMQSAVEEASSTEMGLQEEWSGLSFQNPELSNDNQFIESGKHPIPWQNNIFQNAPTLNSKPENLRTSNASLSFPGFTNFQFPKKEDMRSDSSHESNQQSQKEAGGHAGEFEFVNDASNDGMDFKKRNFKASGGFPASHSSAQTSHNMLELLHKVDKFREYKHGMQSGHTDSPPISETPKAETADAFTPPNNNSSAPQYFGLRLAPPTQKPPMNYLDLSRISQQVPLGTGQHDSNSTRQPNIWMAIPSSTSDAANSRFETASEAPNDYVKAGNDVLEGHVMNSQGFDYGRGSDPNGSSGSLVQGSDRVHHSSSQAPAVSARNTQTHVSPHGYSLLNPAYSETKVPQVNSLSQLGSVYENYRTLLVSSAEREDQRVRNPSHPPLQDASQLHRNSSFVQMNLGTSQYGSVWPVTGTGTNSFSATHLASSASLQHLDTPNQDSVVLKSKKRKFPTYELLPWHKEVIEGSSRLQDASNAELEWAQAANRVPEKLKEETEALGGSPWTVHPKKRIILTTQLMQVLFRPAPAAIFSNDATTHYNIVTYFAARLALGDACCSANCSHKARDISDPSSGKNLTSKISDDQDFLRTIEDFIDRSKKLEDEFLRFENGGSILEMRMESQDLERFSVINRFAKFHSRAQMVAAETASSGGASTVPKLYPQRYVTACPMPRVVPEGHYCLSL